jgi:pentose-5-phosphate-3-epimerase
MLSRYEEAKQKGEDNYDRELEDKIDRLIVECERKIQRALKRLSEEDAKAAIAISVSEVTQVTYILWALSDLAMLNLIIYIC